MNLINKLKVVFIWCNLIKSSYQVSWQGDWAMGCDFHVGQALSQILVPGAECGPRCASTSGCTHFSWNNFDGGTCWMKTGGASKSDAFDADQSMVCGVVPGAGESGGGGPLVKGNLIWSDEFNNNGGPDQGKWNTNTDCSLPVPNYPGVGCGNQEKQYYKPSGNALCNGGYLTITAKNENYGGMQYTSAKLISRQEWRYGVFEARMKTPKGSGTLAAFWLWNYAYPWPSTGEIDIYEMTGIRENQLLANIHTTCCTHGNSIGTHTLVNDPTNTFHDYAVDWNEKRIIWYVDGREYFRQTNNGDESRYPFFTAKPIILNLAVGGNLPGPANPSQFPQDFVIDYVRVYAPNP